MLKYLREDIKKLKAYKVNKIDYQIKLDANEGIAWLNGYNRYPDDSCSELREKLAKNLGMKREEILMGNGSSELIELVMKAYLEAEELVISISPTFSMYKIFTIIHKGNYEEYPLKDMTSLDVEGFIEFVESKKPKIVILSNPNNPTGTLIPKEDIIKIAQACDCMIVLDEAYVEFAEEETLEEVRQYKNLIVLRTFSKALGLAGIRLGYMIADAEIIDYINRVRSPYNVNSLTQATGLRALENEEELTGNVRLIKEERERVRTRLEEMGYIPLPSQGNFLFFKGEEGLYAALVEKKVLIRAYGGGLKGYYRLTIGTPEENDIALAIMEEVRNETGKDK